MTDEDEDMMLSAALRNRKERLPQLEQGIILNPAFIMLYLRGPLHRAITGIDNDLKELGERVAQLEKTTKQAKKGARNKESHQVDQEPATR